MANRHEIADEQRNLLFEINQQAVNLNRVIVEQSIASVESVMQGNQGLEDKLKTYVSLKSPEEHARETVQTSHKKLLAELPAVENGRDYHEATELISLDDLEGDSLDEGVIKSLFDSDGNAEMKVELKLDSIYVVSKNKSGSFGWVNFNLLEPLTTTLLGAPEDTQIDKEFLNGDYNLYFLGRKVKTANTLLSVAEAVVKSAVAKDNLLTIRPQSASSMK